MKFIFNINKKRIMNCLNNSSREEIIHIVDNMNSKMFCRDIVLLAFKRGYIYNLNTPDYIKDSIVYLKYIIKKYPFSNLLNSALDYCNPTILNDELIREAIKKGYVLNTSSKEFLKNNQEYIFLMLQNRGNNEYYDFLEFLNSINQESIEYDNISVLFSSILDILSFCDNVRNRKFLITNSNFFKYVLMYLYTRKEIQILEKISELVYSVSDDILTDEIVELVIKKGLIINRDTSSKILSSKKYIRLLVKTGNVAIIDYCLKDCINNELIELCVSNGYTMNENTPNYLRNNSYLVDCILKSKNIELISDMMDYVNYDIFNKELSVELIKSGYYYYENYDFSVPMFIKDNYNLVAQIISYNKCPNIINYCIDIVDDNLVELALANGYMVDANSPKEILNKYFDMFIKMKCINIVDYCDESLLTEEVVNYAINNGYKISVNTPKVIKDNPKYLKEIVVKCSDNDIINSLMNININLLDIGLLKNIISKHPKIIEVLIQRNMLDSLNRVYLKRYGNLFKDTYLEEFSLEFSPLIVFVFKDSPIFSREVINTLGIVSVKRLFRYGYLTEQHTNFENVYNMGEFNNLMECYKVITDDNVKELDIMEFINFTKIYFENIELFGKLLKYNLLEENKVNLLKLCHNKYNQINIPSYILNGNFEKYLYLSSKDLNKNFTDINDIKERIFLILSNHTLREIEVILDELMNNEKIRRLKVYFSNGDMSKLLDVYDKLLNYFSYILKCNSIKKVKSHLKVINEYAYKYPRRINVLIENLYNMESIIKSIYAVNANSCLTKVQDLYNSNDCIIRRKNYKSDAFVLNKKIENRYVDYIEVNSPVYFFQHILNNYGTGGKISDYINPKIMGASYICLSAISNITRSNVLSMHYEICEEDINHLTLLFDTIDLNALSCMSYQDIASGADKNSLNITSMTNNFDTLYQIINMTNSKNEYVVYRESKKGNLIYPSGVFVIDDFPNIHEINGAAYLNVPLVKLNYVSTLFHSNVTECKYSYPKNINLLNNCLDDVLSNVKIKKKRKI